MNLWYDVVDRFGDRRQRFQAALLLSDGNLGARANRGRPLSEDKIQALIWGLNHPSAVVRRCCLEFLDQHPDPVAIPHIVDCLDDSVPRVRWHAVHALICDVCKPGTSYLSGDIIERIGDIAANDPSAKVRAQAQWGLSQMTDHSLGTTEEHNV